MRFCGTDPFPAITSIPARNVNFGVLRLSRKTHIGFKYRSYIKINKRPLNVLLYYFTINKAGKLVVAPEKFVMTTVYGPACSLVTLVSSNNDEFIPDNAFVDKNH